MTLSYNAMIDSIDIIIDPTADLAGQFVEMNMVVTKTGATSFSQYWSVTVNCPTSPSIVYGNEFSATVTITHAYGLADVQGTVSSLSEDSGGDYCFTIERKVFSVTTGQEVSNIIFTGTD